jgi:predicted phosphodiesterase
MKLAVLADIHGNMRALEAVAAHLEGWRPDGVIVAGDIVNRGPRSLDCLQFVQEKQAMAGWQVVRGNHEDYVIRFTQPGLCLSETELALFQSTYWTYHQLHQDVSALQALPFQLSLPDPAGEEVRVVHASMHNTRDGIFPKTTDEQLREKISTLDQPAPSLFCTAHTHWPLIRQLDQTLVVNVGSVGLPFDHDSRAAYAQLTWLGGAWQAEIVRLDYDRQAAEQDFFDTGFMEEGGALAQLILDELRFAHPNLFQWTHRYEALVLAGEMSMIEAVSDFLSQKYPDSAARPA